jgi:hypothetical protein
VVPVTAIACAGWLFVFFVLLIVPPSPGPRRGGGPGDGRELGPDGDEPPAVISLLDGKLDRTGFGATLVGLAARGWFQVRRPGGGSGAGGPGGGGGPDPGWGPAGPAMCVVPTETPGGRLAPVERRVLAHVALRAGAAGQVPAPALSDGFEGGEADFMSAFREEVDAEARRRGLTRPRLSGRRIGLLCLLLFVPVATVPAAVAAAHQHYWLAWAAGLYVAGGALALGVGTSRRRTAAGQAALKRWRSAVAAAPGEGGPAGCAAGPGDGRLAGYAAALGAAPAALAVFAPGRKNTAWTSYRGGWQQLEIETSTWSWPLGCLTSLAIVVGPVLYIAVAVWASTHGMAGLAKAMVGLILAAAVAGVLAWLARRATPPPFAEFDGQVIRQWMVKGDSDSPDEYHVAVDDGTRETAWDFDVGSERYRRLTPGTFVHVRVNLRDRADLTVAPVEPPAVARPLAGVAADQERAATRGLPDPEDLVTPDEAAAVLGGKNVNGKHVDVGPGRSMVWLHAKTTRPMLRVEVRYLADARPVAPGAWRVPGVADGYLIGQAAGVIVPPLMAILSVHGPVPAGPGRLTALLPMVEGRLREMATRMSGPVG